MQQEGCLEQVPSGLQVASQGHCSSWCGRRPRPAGRSEGPSALCEPCAPGCAVGNARMCNCDCLRAVFTTQVRPKPLLQEVGRRLATHAWEGGSERRSAVALAGALLRKALQSRSRLSSHPQTATGLAVWDHPQTSRHPPWNRSLGTFWN